MARRVILATNRVGTPALRAKLLFVVSAGVLIGHENLFYLIQREKRVGNIIMQNRFIRVGEQIFAIDHIAYACHYGDIVEVSVVSRPESIRLEGRDAEAFWVWHTSRLNTITLDSLATPALS